MTIETTLALTLAMLVLAATPGPGVFATVAQALGAGFRSALDVVAGIVVGDLLFLILALLGLASVATAFGELFFAIKLIGGAYLVWLGVALWRSVPRRFEDAAQLARRTPRQRFLAGLALTLSNPKVIVFYLGFLPSFMDVADLAAADIAAVVGIVTGVLALVLTAYAWSAARARRLFADTASTRLLNRGAGAVMIGAGLVIATR